MQKAFAVDLNKCTGCQACQLACVIENELDLTANWRQVFTFNEPHLPTFPHYHLSLACNHCLDPVCMKYCPALAYHKNEQTGAVTIDTNACIGCQYCSWVCPYDAPKMNHAAGIMEKCTFCNHRLQEGLSPACVALCPTGALQIETYQSDSPPIETGGFPQSDIQPAIRLIPLKPGRQTPEYAAEPVYDSVKDFFMVEAGKTRSKISLKKESSLMVFSVLAAFLVGALWANIFTGSPISQSLFGAGALLALGVSLVHLGKRLRAYRAILNLRHSWLSREIFSFGAFTVLGLIFLSGKTPPALGWLTALAGLTLLLSVDQVYRVIPQPVAAYFHSAQVLLSGFLIAGVLSANLLLTALFAGIKFALYLRRKTGFSFAGKKYALLYSAVRLFFGLVFPLILGFISFEKYFYWIAAGVCLGELIDRAEFYLELDILSPARQVEIDLQRQVERDGRE